MKTHVDRAEVAKEFLYGNCFIGRTQIYCDLSLVGSPEKLVLLIFDIIPQLLRG